MLRLPRMTNTTVATIASLVDKPSCASPAAEAIVSIRFLGFTAARNAPSPAASQGLRESTRSIHLGMVGAVPGAGLLAQLRRARSRNTTPRRILPQEAESEAVEFVATLPSCDTT